MEFSTRRSSGSANFTVCTGAIRPVAAEATVSFVNIDPREAEPDVAIGEFLVGKCFD